MLLKCDNPRDEVDAVTFLKLANMMYIHDLGNIFRDADFDLASECFEGF